ncbi:arginine vasopressin-induced protein 1-like [Megalops cyprinoides]|uniref:arginine vasopressin-induced protein 1-like n=1 Tax=Megalops cyprinoides TaxID=118141 RepID=UPI0018643709|nr:arginine vasopressin-induced protein 1-like [Megalops cyprinoides]XP_036402055.1 arginine vasopressin-induced protein 1-like [Megalops cyprinoides]
MEAPAAHPPTVAGPSQLWQPARRRSRKAGSPNIFRGMNVHQLQRLFQRAGDQDAEQRAELVWGHGDAADLAQALVELRARRRRGERRGEAAGATLGPKWLRAFGHLRINDGTASSPDENDEKDIETEPCTPNRPSVVLQGVAGSQGEASTADRSADSEQHQAAPSGSLWSRARVLKQRGTKSPERYLHRIIH